MKLLLLVWFLLFSVMEPKAKTPENQPLRLIATTPTPELKGDLEFFAADLKGNRLFLCTEDSKTVEVFNLQTGKRLRTIKGFGQPHDVVYLPDSNKLIVTDGGDDFGWVELVDGTSYKIIDKIKMPPAADEARFNPVDKNFYVQSHSAEPGAKTHLINIIDTVNFKYVGSIIVPGNRAGAMVLDRAGEKLYFNNVADDQVVAVDLRTRRVVATWPVPADAHIPDGIALDDANHRLFSATREPPRFFAFDTATGKVVATLPCVAYNDAMTFDAARKRIYITGTLSATVIEERDPNHYELIAEVPQSVARKNIILHP